jgi:hypothetical protein
MQLKRYFQFSSKTSRPPLLYSCSTLTMYEFIRIVTGQVDPPVNWETIYSEYSEISASSSINKTLDLAIQITYLTNRINIVQSIVERLHIRKNQDAIDLLIEMGFYFDFEDLGGDLQRVLTKLKGDEVKLNRYKSEYSESGNGEKATEQDWYEILSELGKFQGYAVNPNKTTVSEYCALEKRFRMHIEYLKSKERN